MAVRPSPTQPLILLENEDIKFVEDDFSSSSSGKHPGSGLSKNKPPEEKTIIPTKNEDSALNPQDNKEQEEGNTPLYTEIIVIPSEPEYPSNSERPMESLKLPTTPDFPSSPSSSLRSNISSGFILNILKRSPRLKRKSRNEYEMVSGNSARDEDSTYSNVSAISTKGDPGGSRRKISGSNTEVRKNDPKVEEDEQILEALRQMVRKCTNPDPMKRPASKDLFDIVEITYDKS